MNNLHCLNPQEAANRFEEMIPFLKRLIAKFPEGTYTLGGIMSKFAKNEWTCWIITMGPDKDSDIQAVIASCAYPDMAGTPTLNIEFVTGHNPDMLVDTLTEFHTQALRYGIQKIQILGRRGWSPFLKDLNYSADLIMYRKTLDDSLVNMNTEGSA